jgi:uncharacterized protein YecT (DUF1311 family)
MIKLSLIFSIIALFGSKVSAQTKLDCANAKTQLEMNVCAQQQFAEVDKQLNIIYKKVIAKCSIKQLTSLVKAQKAWLTYRDEHAAIERMLYDGGSIAPMMATGVKTTATQARIKELQDLLDEMEL